MKDCGCNKRESLKAPRPIACCPKDIEVLYVEIPASMGTSAPGQPYAPKNGAYRNTVVKYVADATVWLYTTAGIPVQLNSGVIGGVISVNGKNGEVVLKTSDLENDSGYIAAGSLVAGDNVSIVINPNTNEITISADIPEDLVKSVNGKTGAVVLTATDVGALPDTATIPTKTSDLNNDSDFQTGQQVTDAIGIETTAREQADNGLQGQIDALSASSDVTDIVGTYVALQAYDTSTLGDNDIIKVLQDEQHSDETTYYRWSTTTQTFTLIGEEGPYYTKSAADAKFQDKLTAGANINIDANNEISATDTTYSDFIGTDGTAAGTAGLVPAPATTDADKFLKSDGTWDTAGSAINVVQTTGTSTTDVMSQDATTKMIWPSISTPTYIRIGGGSTSSPSANAMGIGWSAQASEQWSMAIGGSSTANASRSIAIGGYASTNGTIFTDSVALGASSKNHRKSEVSIGDGSNNADHGTRYLANVTDPALPQDAATKNYVDNVVISFAAISGATAPTTATEAKYVGQLYYDTTNDKMYYLVSIDTSVAPVEYNWNALGGGLADTTTFWGQTASGGAVSGNIALGTAAMNDPKTVSANNGKVQVIFGHDSPDNGYDYVQMKATNNLTSKSATLEVMAENNAYISSNAPLYMGNKQIKNLADGMANTDAVNKGQLDAAISGIALPSVFTTNEWNALWS